MNGEKIRDGNARPSDIPASVGGTPLSARDSFRRKDREFFPIKRSSARPESIAQNGLNRSLDVVPERRDVVNGPEDKTARMFYPVLT